MRWALEGAPNPTLLRLHAGVALTAETVVTCPPGTAPALIDRLLEIEAIRSIDLHPYRARLNLYPGAGRAATARHVTEVLTPAWGPPAALVPDAGPRVFEARSSSGKVVAESPAMAEGHPLLEAVFGVEGVTEAIAGEGMVLVRLGRLFDWAEGETAVAAALQSAGGMPGSTSLPS